MMSEAHLVERGVVTPIVEPDSLISMTDGQVLEGGPGSNSGRRRSFHQKGGTSPIRSSWEGPPFGNYPPSPLDTDGVSFFQSNPNTSENLSL